MGMTPGNFSEGGGTPLRNAAHAETRAGGLTRRGFLGSVTAAAGALAAPWSGLAAAEERPAPEDGEREKIEAALPAKAPVPPRKRRKLLIFDLNVGYGGHPSAQTANLALQLMGRKTGAFETEVSRDPSIFKPETLKQFDAVLLNNTVGNLFTDAELRRSLLEFVSGGRGLMGLHGTSVAFTRWPGAYEDWPEFGEMLGARGASHRDSDERVFVNLSHYGNTSAASIPIALAEARAQGKLKTGDLVLLAAFGAGLTWGSVLVRM